MDAVIIQFYLHIPFMEVLLMASILINVCGLLQMVSYCKQVAIVADSIHFLCQGTELYGNTLLEFNCK